MENKLSLKIQSSSKKIQRTFTTEEKKLKKIDNLANILDFKKANSLLNALVDEYLDKGVIEYIDEENNERYEIRVKEVLDKEIKTPQELKDYMRSRS